RDTETNGFLDTLGREAASRVDVIPAHKILWRAPLWRDWGPWGGDQEGGGEGASPFPPPRMKPPRGQAPGGRANPKGIPYLYLSTHRETALAEVRPWVGSFVSAAQLKTARDLRIVNCTEDSKRKHFFGATPAEYWDTAVWCDIDAAFSRPVTLTDEYP